LHFSKSMLTEKVGAKHQVANITCETIGIGFIYENEIHEK